MVEMKRFQRMAAIPGQRRLLECAFYCIKHSLGKEQLRR